MGSYEGITRGASKKIVYDAYRAIEMAPTRLFIDGQNNAEWRLKDFYPVLNERNPGTVANRDASLRAKILVLKREHPFPKTGLLPTESFDVSIDREQSCPAIEEFGQYADEHPEGGMPFGLPALSNKQQQMLIRWLEVGAPVEAELPLAKVQLEQVAHWEVFLNGDSLKSQLMSRYIYEHWFLVHLYFDSLTFDNQSKQQFFELVRSETPPGQPIQFIASRRPFDDRHVQRVFYRLRRARNAAGKNI
jgi:Fatty acid cis/trans isomerase (CTI)